ncbi:FtsW/RodA/SpoVE family cell cycle protein [Sporolactobacillus sp. CPB3-1]|uniref:Probable peptidoglycan glycosyltransferase FtsW n=1 Tax=Sporolactobacillus mangiferae TaxID=2940498 RepID=A0ABT0M7X7_9BACL|nr:FtsW/RodA/SpoVE family cell cycle protein [Sporolactobacillus mangiferae]MCL1630971.1 FtsW/RodA/SpoVE family cell cycle protein [Sporolactobacillus mangiferae]
MIKKMFRHFDYSLLTVMLLLIAFGLIMVYSAGSVWASVFFERPQPPSYFFTHQLAWFVLSVPIGTVGLLLPYPVYRKLVKPLIAVSIFLLGALFVLGNTVNNAQSWFRLGSFNIQPSELVKITVILYLASVFSNKQNAIADFKTSVAPPLVVVIVFFCLIAAQPDFGTAMILMLISAVMVLCAGLRARHILILSSVAAGFVALFYKMFLSSNQLGRFTAAYDPFSVADNTGRQLINSYVAIASGGLTGRGLGQSIEKTGFLPEPQTDFIIAIIGEELGLLGILFVILCLAYLVFRGFVTAIRCKDVFGSLLAIGISSMVAVQTFVNLGAATGLLPIAGVTLPFVSYGGSSLIMMVFSICVLLNISAFVNMNRSTSRMEGKRENVEAKN